MYVNGNNLKLISHFSILDFEKEMCRAKYMKDFRMVPKYVHNSNYYSIC